MSVVRVMATGVWHRVDRDEDGVTYTACGRATRNRPTPRIGTSCLDCLAAERREVRQENDARLAREWDEILP